MFSASTTFCEIEARSPRAGAHRVHSTHRFSNFRAGLVGRKAVQAREEAPFGLLFTPNSETGLAGAVLCFILAAPGLFHPLAASLSPAPCSRAASTPRPAIARKLGAAAFSFSSGVFAMKPALRLFHRKPDLKEKAMGTDSHGDEQTRGQRI